MYFVTTDGAGEYTAAFKYFGPNYRSIHLMSASEENLDWLDVSGDVSATESSIRRTTRSSSCPDSNENAESDSEEDPDAFVRANDSRVGEDSNADPESFQIQDPNMTPLLANMKRIDCSAHKLDKMGKCDCDRAIGNDPGYDDLHDRVFTKLEDIWNLKDSRLKAEIFTRITGKKLVGPHRIRWLKLCEAVSRF